MNRQDDRGGKRALKNVSVQQLETAIAAALFKVTSEKYEVDIRRFELDLGVQSGISLRDGAIIELRAVASERVADGTPDPLQRAKAACSLVGGGGEIAQETKQEAQPEMQQEAQQDVMPIRLPAGALIR